MERLKKLLLLSTIILSFIILFCTIDQILNKDPAREIITSLIILSSLIISSIFIYYKLRNPDKYLLDKDINR